MVIPELIAKKRDGIALSADDVKAFFQGYQKSTVADYQMAAMLMAICVRGLSDEERNTLVDVMLHSGQVLDLSGIEGFKCDKHSTGGVGDKVSLSLAPIVAACGVKVPMVSGRGLGHTGGTLDKLESCPGFSVNLDVEKFTQLVGTVGVGLIGQTKEIAPLDKRLYALRDVTGTVESIPLIACSIMSKKLAEGIDGLVLDVKVGSGAFMRDVEKARELAEIMVAMGKAKGKKVVALLTQMSQPLGHMIGNALEWREATDMLRGKGPADYRECVFVLAAEMIHIAGLAPSLADARVMAEQAVSSGAALRKWREIIVAQGGDASFVDEPERLHPAPYKHVVNAVRVGYVDRIDVRGLGLLALSLGAGRQSLEAKIDFAVGLDVRVKVGDKVAAGQPLAFIHGRRPQDGAEREDEVRQLIHVGAKAVDPLPLVLDRVG